MQSYNQPTYPHTHTTWTVEEEQVGQRLDRFLTQQLDGVSRSTIQQLISDQSVVINGKPASKTGYSLRLHDVVQVLSTIPSSTIKNVTPQAIPLDIVYEDDDLVVVNKASGMVVHPAPGHYEDTLVNALLARYPEMRSHEEDLRPGIVHRLDRDTSGLLIVARNLRTQAALIELMKQHEVEKRYLALVEGIVELDRGSIDAPIGRDPRDRQKMTITSIDSRDAVTHFKVLERYSQHTLLLLQLETGRTHQIRVHLKAIKHPVVGDTTYGSGRLRPGITLHRQFLHAFQLRFKHPWTGEVIEIEAPLAPDLQPVLDNPNVL
jgi:23S rRNA pseudouridine1911/1915/1917 synthase